MRDAKNPFGLDFSVDIELPLTLLVVVCSDEGFLEQLFSVRTGPMRFEAKEAFEKLMTPQLGKLGGGFFPTSRILLCALVAISPSLLELQEVRNEGGSIEAEDSLPRTDTLVGFVEEYLFVCVCSSIDPVLR